MLTIGKPRGTVTGTAEGIEVGGCISQVLICGIETGEIFIFGIFSIAFPMT
jgi:hypothetical protein